MALDPEIEAAFSDAPAPKTQTTVDDPEINAAFADDSSGYMLHPDPNVSGKSDRPLENPLGQAVGGYNKYAGNQLVGEGKLLSLGHLRDPRSIQDIRDIPAATETVLGLAGGRGSPANRPFGVGPQSRPFGIGQTAAPTPHPLQAAANDVQSKIDTMESQARAEGFELPDRTPSPSQNISNRLSRRQLKLPDGAPLEPEMLHEANAKYVSPAYDAVSSRPEPLQLSDKTKATFADVKPLMPAREAASIPDADNITYQQGVELSKALRAKAKQFPDYGVDASNRSWDSIAQAHVDAAKAVEGDIRNGLAENGQEALADNWEKARVYRAVSGSYEEALDGAGNVRVPELKKQLLRQGVPLSGEAQMLAKIGARYPEQFKSTPAAPTRPGFVRRATAATLPAAGAAAGAAIAGAPGAVGGEFLGKYLGDSLLKP